MSEITTKFNEETKERDVLIGGKLAGSYWWALYAITARLADGLLVTCYDSESAVAVIAKNAGAPA